MSSSGKKRNFTHQERILLLGILKSYKNIIDNKKTDNVNAAIKKRAWADIAVRYNKSAIITERASGEQLRRLWLNIKSRNRALLIQRSNRLAAENGGPCPDAPIDPDIKEDHPSILLEMSKPIDSDLIRLPTTTDDADSKFVPETEVDNTQSATSIISESELPPSNLICPPESNNTEYYSNNERRLRIQILKTEHLNRERRAEELHQIQIEHLKAKFHLENLILHQSLREITAKAELAQENLCQDT